MNSIDILFVVLLSISAVNAQEISAIAALHGDSPQTHGTVTFTQAGYDQPVLVDVIIIGLVQGLHGFHVHAFGDLSDGCDSLGPHYNPESLWHGGRDSAIRHIGDLGNVLANSDGLAVTRFYADGITLFGEQSIIGRGLILHADRDDYGLGGASDSLTTGNSGPRLICGVIQPF